MNNKFSYTLLISLLLLTAYLRAEPLDNYKPGDVIDFRIESNSKIIGTQKATYVGLTDFEGESLSAFEMQTKTVFERGGRTFDLDLTCQVGYLPDGLPRRYSFDLSVLNAKVTHEGRFSKSEYMGTTTRIGVKQPFNIPTPDWARLLDNNFALQWEIATSSINLAVGDSTTVESMIPQLNQHLPITIIARPAETVVFGKQRVTARVLHLRQVNQTFYFDAAGKLLKAEDKVSGISVIRQAEGESAEIVRPSVMAMINNRLPGYLILLAFALAWLIALALSQAKAPQVWIAFIVAAGLYWLSLEALMPIQNAYFGWAIDPRGSSANTYILLFGSALIFSIFEMASIAVPLIVLFLIKRFGSIKVAVAIGAAAGAGYGFMQSVNLTGFLSDGSFAAGADVIQKLGLIGVSAICGSILAILIVHALPAQFYLIPIGIKALLNWFAVLVQKGVWTIETHAVISLLLAGLSFVLLWVMKSQYRAVHDAKKQIRTN